MPVVPPQNRPHPGLQFGHVERFDDIVVGTAVQPAEPAVQVVAGGNDQYRHGAARSPQFGQNLQAVAARQTEVEQDEVVRLRLHRRGHLSTVFNPIDGITAVFQPAGGGFGNHGIVFNQ